MTQRPPDRDSAGPGTGPDGISSTDELRAAVVHMLGTSDDRAVERRVGVSKTTVNDLRNGRRRLTLKTLTLIAEAYDPDRRDAWLAAWHRLHPRPIPVPRPQPAASGPTQIPAAPSAAVPGVPGAPTDLAGSETRVDRSGPDVPAGAEISATRNALSAPATPVEPVEPVEPVGAASAAPVEPAEPGAAQLSQRTARALTGSALLAAVAAVAAMVFVLTNDDSTVVLEPGGIEQASSRPGDGVKPLPFGPGGPGAPAPVGGPGPPPGPGLPPPFEASGQGGAPAAGAVPGAGAGSGGAAATSGCYTLPLPTTAEIIDGPESEPGGIRVTAASYQYFPAWSPSVMLGGQLDSRPADGRILVAAAWADPTTTDSTPARNPGTGRFFPGHPLELTDQNCFMVQPYNLGYGGYSGITTRVYFMLVDLAELPALPREAHQQAGLTDEDLARHGVDVLGYFAIPSPR
ncbi:helix-turn-helix domain-containing protein [Parafrankia elaeagni]|uniref:helix-turn-helix domain-containing protein n=1 Tax=Parafrankia elaeagni TaxID=222534 RepID=UPI000477372A|nr:helix-turn-helix transcriptional regulator [Parafrankia elaeagni]